MISKERVALETSVNESKYTEAKKAISSDM